MATQEHTVIDRNLIRELTARETRTLDERTAASGAFYDARTPRARERRRVLLPGARPVADLRVARPGLTRLGRSTAAS